MGILDLFLNPSRKAERSLDRAEELLKVLIRPQDPPKSRSLEKALKEYPSRQARIERILELCGDQQNPRQRYIRAMALSFEKSDDKNRAITAFVQYLAGEPYEGAYLGARHTLGNRAFSPEEEKKIHLAEMYTHLGALYSTRADFKQAFACAQKEMELTPFYPGPYCRASDLCVKKNQLPEAMNILAHAKKTDFYRPVKYKDGAGETITEDTFRRVIDRHVEELQKKIDRGYEYNPKKKKP